MSEYIPPCNTQGCKLSYPWETRLCRNIATSIIAGGGAGVFEATPCPFEALWVIAAAGSERMDDVRQRLGIVGTTGIEGDF
jgi:hypothetical protein